MTISKKQQEKKKEERKGVDLFTIVEEKEEHTVNRILSRKIEAPVVTLSDSEKEIKRRSELFIKFKEKYLLSIKMYTEKGFVLDSPTFNICCSLLRESLDFPDYDKKMVNILKTLITEVSRDDGVYLLYIYSMTQSAMITYIQEYYNYVENFDTQKTIDRAYKEVFDEIRTRRKRNGKNS